MKETLIHHNLLSGAVVMLVGDTERYRDLLGLSLHETILITVMMLY